MGAFRQKVALENVRFFAYHGFYPEEQLTGNEFVLTLETEQDIFTNSSEDLSSTVNYERLFEIANDRMKQTKKLLETVAYAILDDIHREFLAVDFIRVSIRKTNLPMAGDIGNSLVELTYKR
ncbi:dihydroneopterin aldolase [Pedobacter sp. HMF7647]|uniref:7,8-dihydroneopterin aldolase n=1 Tax=Hufsiella arboris TaxID=2695275 RepID=A0A7K1Y7X9_9SPHI|nr:dihydroneopterin aldolase [Hufsiella arboris]MXV50471.1 dihydroneopterin aldolase [Hufsiella arboris]